MFKSVGLQMYNLKLLYVSAHKCVCESHCCWYRFKLCTAYSKGMLQVITAGKIYILTLVYSSYHTIAPDTMSVNVSYTSNPQMTEKKTFYSKIETKSEPEASHGNPVVKFHSDKAPSSAHPFNIKTNIMVCFDTQKVRMQLDSLHIIFLYQESPTLCPLEHRQ